MTNRNRHKFTEPLQLSGNAVHTFAVRPKTPRKLNIEIPIVRSPYSAKPELWIVGNRTHLVVPSKLVTSQVLHYGAQSDNNTGFEVKTARTIYTFQWAPTVRHVTLKQLQTEQAIIHQRHLMRT